MAQELLNPQLFRSLQRRFGVVRVSNQGQRYLVRKRRDPFHPEKQTDEVCDAGEYYVLCCPFCNDTRFRLYVNHRWNTRLPNGQVFGRHLIHCFNENCDLRAFEDELKPYITGRPLLQRPVDLLAQKAELFKAAQWPGTCVPLSALPAGHAALEYIRGREFDPRQLEQEWGVRYCQEAAHPLVRNRLIFPVYKDERMVGWQTRALGPADPKYFTMPGLNKAHLLATNS